MTTPTPSHPRQEHGYTLVEVLVVCVIIGILASIALAAFSAQASKAQGAPAKALARTAETAIATHFVDAGSYDTDSARLVAIEPALGQASGLTVQGTATTYRVSVDDVRGRTYGIERAGTGAVVRFCSPAGEGACSDAGDW